jgi:trimethylamine:corrinoid methyltransferase-like protein
VAGDAHQQSSCQQPLGEVTPAESDALAEYQAPPLDESVDAALQDFMDRRKAEMQDAWY